MKVYPPTPSVILQEHVAIEVKHHGSSIRKLVNMALLRRVTVANVFPTRRFVAHM